MRAAVFKAPGAPLEITEVPDPKASRLPDWLVESPGDSGTLVVWTRCDRLDHRRVSTIARNLPPPLGRVFRYYLWDGVTILINGENVESFDPLYLHEDSAEPGAQLYGKPIELKRNEERRSAVLSILDPLVECGSSAAYKMRDDFVTPLPLIAVSDVV